jgi:hypothetical protein
VAFNILNRKAMGYYPARHWDREFVEFLGKLEREVPLELDLHSYHTTKSGVVRRWLKPKKRR